MCVCVREREREKKALLPNTKHMLLYSHTNIHIFIHTHIYTHTCMHTYMHLSYRVCQTVKSTTTRNTAPHDHHQDTRRPVSPGDHRCGIHRPTTRASRFRKRFPPTTGAFKDSSIILPRIYWQDAHILARFRSTAKNTSFKYWRDSEMSMPKGGQYVGKYDVAFRQTMSDGARKLCTAASAPRGYPNQLPSP